MEKWKKTDCEHFYETYTFISSKGFVEMPHCQIQEFNCNGCEKYHVNNRKTN